MTNLYSSDGLANTPYAKRKTRRFTNYFKTALLLAALSSLVLVIGHQLGGGSGLLMAGVVVVIMNFVSFWFSDRIALAMNGAKPVERNQLPAVYDMIKELSAKAGMPMPRVYLIHSPTPNAFATGRDPEHGAVAVTTGILGLLDHRELSGVLAHELTHIRNRDTLIATVAATLAGVISQAAYYLFFFGGMLGGGRSDDRDSSGLANLGLMLVAPIAATLIQLAISRSREYGADAGGAALCGDPNALADALQKLQRGVQLRPDNHAASTASLFIVNPLKGVGVASLFSTHPATEERVQKLRAMAKTGTYA